MNSILGKWIKKRNKSDFVVLILLGVMLTFSDEGTDQLDKNVTKDGNKKEETTVVYDTGDTRQPYVICRQMPKIEGVVVVAQGGGNAKTVTEISNAVMSLFPVEAHKVVVVKMSVQEE